MRNPAPHASVPTSSALGLRAQDLQGKVALVTGASRGIGRAISLHLFSRGASILATCSSLSSMHHIESLKYEAMQQCREPNRDGTPKIVGVAANLLSPEFPTIIANKARDAFDGKLNIIVNNANYVDFRSMGELDAEYVQKQLMGNVQSLVLLMDILFAKRYIQPKSRIINISSEASRTPLPFPGFMLYAATKSAMESLTRSWADILSQDERTFGTTVNSLAVGATATLSYIESHSPQDQESALQVLRDGQSVHNGCGRPEDIANIAGLVASEEAHWINGSVVAANGGGTHKIL
ncbi:hypothetical protein NM208_g5778 [Fusarium decemcellulare]|uniref:Uncharacterized protein n=1 Tax=Fusarium decemcellulare TaxID=57161 RepID=A0ACC1SFN9_9HYPO|nr:hypothetical protein NM208_g5778 [Fusarium decemcellulare]